MQGRRQGDLKQQASLRAPRRSVRGPWAGLPRTAALWLLSPTPVIAGGLLRPSLTSRSRPGAQICSSGIAAPMATLARRSRLLAHRHIKALLPLLQSAAPRPAAAPAGDVRHGSNDAAGGAASGAPPPPPLKVALKSLFLKVHPDLFADWPVRVGGLPTGWGAWGSGIRCRAAVETLRVLSTRLAALKRRKRRSSALT